MPWSHVALATGDIVATHHFYTEAMGFRLAKVVAAPTPSGDGWARHVFYDCGDGEFVAFWDLHDPGLPAVRGDLSESLGLPNWVNHLAWDAADAAALDACKERWRALGLGVAEIDHGFCRSIYTTDPNGIMVEFCWMTAPLGDAAAAEASQLLAAERPPLSEPPPVRYHEPSTAVAR